MSETPTTRRAHKPAGRILRTIPMVALVAVIVITASSEWALARTVLALPPAVAWAVPVAIDSYVVAALRTGRDVGAAMSVMAGALCASTAAHLFAADLPEGEKLPVEVTAPTAAVIMAVLVVVAWRVHVLIDRLDPEHQVAGCHAMEEPTQRAPEPAASPRRQPVVEAGPREAARALASASAPAESASLPAPVSAHPAGRDAHGVSALGVPVPGVSVSPVTPAPEGRERPAVSAVSAVSAPVAALRADARPDTPRSDSTRVSRTGTRTDEEILAEIAVDPPSIRALMRAYGIGQARATRLHQQATGTADLAQPDRAAAAPTPGHIDQDPLPFPQDPTPTSPNGTSTSPHSTQNSPETQHEETPTKAETKADQTPNPGMPEEKRQRTDEESQTEQKEQSHPGITDRVGRPSPAAGAADRASRNGVTAIPGGSVNVYGEA